MAATHYLEAELRLKLQQGTDIWDFVQKSCLDGLWYWDLEKPENEWMSPEFWELFGIAPDSRPHTPESWFDIIHQAIAGESCRRRYW